MKKIKRKNVEICESEYLELLTLRQENADLKVKVEKLNITLENKDKFINFLARKVFGTTSEKTNKVEIIDPRQLKLFDTEEEALKDSIPEEPKKESSEVTKKKKKGRRKINPDLPIEKIYLDIPENEKFDENGQPLVCIGYEISSRLDYKPAAFIQKLFVRKVYGYEDSREYVKVAAHEPSIVPKGKLTDGFIHHIVYEKFVNAMPLHRQMKDYNLKGADVSKSILSEMIIKFADLYKLLSEAIKKQIFSSIFVHADESPLKYGQGKGAKYKNGVVYVFRDNDQVYFFYGGNKTQDQIKNILTIESDSSEDVFTGYLMCDGYAGYNVHAGKLMDCWTHARRKFFVIAKNNANAMDILKLINKLYKYENEINELALENNWCQEVLHENLYKIRNEKSKDVIQKIYVTTQVIK